MVDLSAKPPALGRPKVETPSRDTFLAVIAAERGRTTHVARRLGISTSTLYRIFDEKPEYRELCDEHRRYLLADYEDVAHEMAMNGDGPMLRFLIAGMREQQALKVDVNVSGGLEHRHRDVRADAAYLEQVRAVIEAAKAEAIEGEYEDAD